MAEADYAVVASMRTPAKRYALRVELDRRTTTAEVLQLGKLAKDLPHSRNAYLFGTLAATGPTLVWIDLL